MFDGIDMHIALFQCRLRGVPMYLQPFWRRVLAFPPLAHIPDHRIAMKTWRPWFLVRDLARVAPNIMRSSFNDRRLIDSIAPTGSKYPVSYYPVSTAQQLSTELDEAREEINRLHRALQAAKAERINDTVRTPPQDVADGGSRGHGDAPVSSSFLRTQVADLERRLGKYRDVLVGCRVIRLGDVRECRAHRAWGHEPR